MLTQTLHSILQASVYDVALQTPLEKAHKLSAKLNNDIRLKREDLQPVFSFKLRGAYNKISQLSESEKQAGVICASAGNHAQGVAFSAHKLGLKNLIIMPKTTPDIKVQAVKRLGGTVLLHGDSFDEANRFAIDKARTEGMTYIAPYDDPLVIAGQGTVGQELLQAWRELDYVFVACGGGGLLAGVCAFLGAVAPHIKVVAVEPDGACCLKVALEQGKPVRLPQVSLFADGVAVAEIGQNPFKIITLQKSDNSGILIEPDVITCTNDEICSAIKDIFEENRCIVETAGALSVAGMKKFIKINNIKNKNCVAIISGANINFDRLRYVAERTEIGENKEAIFAVRLPERTGAFLDFCRCLAGRNITEFNYRFDATSPDVANVFVGIALKDGQAERTHLTQIFNKNNYLSHDLTDDEAAKTHIRYLVGGHGRLNDEKIFRVMFPERPNALLNFLENLKQEFNITLFHYRNHGAAEGRVLVGLQATAHASRQIIDAMNDIGYTCEDLSENVGYGVFLK